MKRKNKGASHRNEKDSTRWDYSWEHVSPDVIYRCGEEGGLKRDKRARGGRRREMEREAVEEGKVDRKEEEVPCVQQLADRDGDVARRWREIMKTRNRKLLL